LNDRQPDAAATDDSNGRSRFDARGVRYGTDAGRDRTTDERDRVQRRIVSYPNSARCRYHRVFSE
jgi:hypothetical protein